ncbi:hypothetical protein [Salidesulfovibrio brasiliensis]|uniref:hypothetical protein n=1 Tax=Salidesulfovibrio brasiliensis TaxID=221711 RepID=UPI0006D0A5D8|nr:hypothetical protein [Salidesulfovibrio brasiliensis]
MNVPPAEGEALVIRRNPAIVQEVDYMENGPFPAETHERALDRLTMICQSLSERLDRAVSLRVSSAVSGVEMPDPQDGAALCWNTEGNLANGPSALDIAEAYEHAELARLCREAAETARDEAVQAAGAGFLPDPAELSALALLRVDAATQAYECRTPQQVCADIGAAPLAAANTWTQAQRYGETSLAISAGDLAWDMEDKPKAAITLSEDVTTWTVTNPGPGELTLTQDATGGRTVAWPASWHWPGGVPGEVSAEANAVDVLTITERGGTIRAMLVNDFKAVA